MSAADLQESKPLMIEDGDVNTNFETRKQSPVWTRFLASLLCLNAFLLLLFAGCLATFIIEPKPCHAARSGCFDGIADYK